MDFKVNREEITSAEVIFDDTQEQSVELDYVLPDYYPEIFKIIKCMTSPKILSYSSAGDRLTYEMAVYIRVLYCAENSSAVRSVEQKLTYTKTVDFGRTVSNPRVCIVPKIDYINCRAVNSRRIDIRGAVSIKIKVTDLDRREIICDAFGGNIQLKKVPVSFPSNKLYTTKRITVSEEFDLGMSKPPIVNILRSGAVIASGDKKVIANKLIAKGEAYISMLYSCVKDGEDSVESMQFTLPFSQIIDLEGIDERFACTVESEIVCCDIEPRSDGDGNSKVACCTAVILITCSAYRTASAELAVDEYSTAYKTECVKSDVKIELPPQPISSSCVVKASLEHTDGGIDCIYDVWCTVSSVYAKADPENNCIVINGNALYSVMAKSGGEPVLLEKEEPFTASVPAEGLTENSAAEVKLIPVSCSYNLASDSSVEAKAELKITGEITATANICCITELNVDENETVEKSGDYALKLYFADDKEDLWEIAKKYGTSVAAIMEENDIQDDTVTGGGMILIPIL